MEKVLRLLVLIIGVLVIGSLVSTLTLKKINNLREAQFVSSKDVVSIRDRERQLDCLAKNIYHEAASEPFEGKVAVAQVTMNRAESGKFPSDVCAVVYQKNVIYEKVICQFSWACENTHKIKPVYAKMYTESEEVAKKVLLENFKLSTLTEAMYYHNTSVHPGWKKTKITQIGNHIFYKD